MVLSFFEYLAFKVLETYCNIRRWKPERGQSTAEYVAVTAVAVGLAVTVIFFTLNGALNSAVTSIAEKVSSFADDTVNGGGEPPE